MRSSWRWRTSTLVGRACLKNSGSTFRTWGMRSRTPWGTSRKLITTSQWQQWGCKVKSEPLLFCVWFQGRVCTILPIPYGHNQKVTTGTWPPWWGTLLHPSLYFQFFQCNRRWMSSGRRFHPLKHPSAFSMSPNTTSHFPSPLTAPSHTLIISLLRDFLGL